MGAREGGGGEWGGGGEGAETKSYRTSSGSGVVVCGWLGKGALVGVDAMVSALEGMVDKQQTACAFFLAI